jgi:hypothetical protein
MVNPKQTQNRKKKVSNTKPNPRVHFCLLENLARAPRARRSIHKRELERRRRKSSAVLAHARAREKKSTQRERERERVENFPRIKERVKVLTKSVASTRENLSLPVEKSATFEGGGKVFLEDARKKNPFCLSSARKQKTRQIKKNVIGRRKRREEHKRYRFGTIASRIRVVYSEIFSFVKF